MDGVAAGIVDSLLPPNPSPPLPPDRAPPDSTNADVDLIEAFVVAGVVALSLMHVLGSLRRRSSNRLIHAAVTLAYTQSYALVSYTLGQIMSSDHGVDEFPVWAVCLLLLLGGADCLTARSLGEADGWRDAYVSSLVQVVWVVIIVVFLGPETGYLAPLCPILLVAGLRAYARVVSLRMVGETDRLCESVKPIADYMQHEHRLQLHSGGRPDPVTMEGYRYVVTGEPTQHKHSVKGSELRQRRQKFLMLALVDGVRGGRKSSYVCLFCHRQRRQKSLLLVDGVLGNPRRRVVDDTKITTVEQIWRCRGSLLRSERGLRLKDVCLSMALSRMLNRRFAGFPLAEAGLEKTHDLVFRGLLAGDKPHKRAFRVIEEELALVHDMYYTKYPFLFHMGCYFAVYLPMGMVILCSWLVCLLNHHRERHSRHTTAGSAYAGTTMVLMATLAFMEVFQMYLYMASGWFKVALIRTYVTSPVLQREGFFFQPIIRSLLRLRALQAWQDKLGQYSLLHSLHTSRRCNHFLHYATLFLVHKVGKGRVRGKPVMVSELVKRAIVDSLAGSSGHLTNGVRSLRSNGVHEQLSWACHDGEDGIVVTRAILVWHVATDICKHQLDVAKGKDDKQPPAVFGDDRVAVEASASVATDLSRYCAYLLAFAPSLLPDHRSISASMLSETIEDARKLLRGSKKMEKKCEKLMGVAVAANYDVGGDDDDGGTVPLVMLGARLARQLMEDIQDTALRWRVLAEFWAEMVLYVAPSDDARAHLEALAKGGQFVTHLWALLTHAGVLERDPVSGPLGVV
ncbi:unnamed protein product [Alopecurus aequalis]